MRTVLPQILIHRLIKEQYCADWRTRDYGSVTKSVELVEAGSKTVAATSTEPH